MFAALLFAAPPARTTEPARTAVSTRGPIAARQTAPGNGPAAPPTRPESEKKLARAIYKEFVEIQSGYTTGATTPVADAAAARLRAAGFPDTDVFIGGAHPNKANLVVRYRGTGARKPLLLLAHTDVVEAKPEDWTTNPFQFVEKDGFFYGRGTGDDKAQAAVWIANLIQYKQEAFKPDRDIIVALTADEEGGGPYNGVVWLLKNRRDLIDAELALNEGGWGEEAGGRKLSNDLQVSEKYVVNYRLEVRNKGGHSSMPVPDNAIYRLAGALERLSKFGFPLKTNEVTAAYFKAMAAIETRAIKTDLARVADGSQQAMARVAAASPAWNATLRTTCVATQLEGGHAINALPQLAAATVNCRVLPDDSEEYVYNTLQKVVADEQVSFKPIGARTKGPASAMRPDVLQAVSAVTDSFWPGVPAVPIMVMGATDGAYLRAAGIPTYGVQGFFLDRDDIRFHGRDERMGVQAFYEGQAFLYELVKRLTTSGGVAAAPNAGVAQSPSPTAAAQSAPAPNPLVTQAEQLGTEGKLAEALALYRKALAADPKLVDAHLGAGRTLDVMGDHEAARRHFATAIDLAGPDSKDEALTAMALSYAFEARAADAAKFYERVFADRMAAGNPNGATGTANAMARVYLESGDLANAEKWYRTGYETSKQIKDLTSAQADLWQMRWLHAQARIAARRGNIPDARAHAAALKALLDKGANNGERPQYQYLLGYIALEAGDYDTAIAELQKGNLEDSFVLGLIGRAYEKKGDAANAAEYYRKVMAATTHNINTAFAQQWARKYLRQ